jgi:hypothetical protein
MAGAPVAERCGRLKNDGVVDKIDAEEAPGDERFFLQQE